MHDVYENPLCTRYASEEIKRIFSADVKFKIWRRLWIALAEAERELGLPISEAQIAEPCGGRQHRLRQGSRI